ncbi:hypothetical protein D8674_000289 [Pyrus ussuriensis x Pyrus communis]|uniref:Uncharacterized protein n=1 Tax=Pyrus ussuriensis x Pyrus communis TaxID=2448454 RepID=A0A5N5F2Q4_9ROSA|nr:hypothetical protein D8674_000289 [Pyrus ussuriensis x Pyrus communis]
MSQLITCHWSVTNVPPTLSASTTLGVSAPLIEEPTPLNEATLTAPYKCLASKSRYHHLILLHLRPPSHFAHPIPSSLMYQT